MRAAVSGLPAEPPASFLDELAADFAAIYLTGAYGASPSESFWLSDDHLVCQEAMFDLRALYAASGLAAPDWRMRPDDHLVFQLQFVARYLELALSDDDWRSLASFLDFHLLRWLPNFSSRIAARCDTAFYGALVILTNSWCQQLRDLIADMLDEVRPSQEEIEEQLRAQRGAMPAPEPVHFVPGMHGPSW
jgi:TorA maturation chaperone TorD